MKAQGIELLYIGECETLARAAAIEFIEGIVVALHAAIEEIAGIRSLAVVGQFRVATVHRKIGRRGGTAALDQPRAGAGEAEKVKNVWLRTFGVRLARDRTIGDAAHGVGQFVKRNAHQQARTDVGRKGSGTVVGGSVISSKQPEQFELRIPDRDIGLPLES